MTAYEMKPNPFNEKMTAIKLVDMRTGIPLGTVNNIDFYPASIPIMAFFDFFNIRPDVDYVLTVTAFFPDGTNYPVHATRVNIPEDKFIQLNNGYGKVSGNFTFNFTIEKPSDYFFFFLLIDQNENNSDSFYSYHTFGKGV